jgi:hypothetical protein
VGETALEEMEMKMQQCHQSIIIVQSTLMIIMGWKN